MRLWIGTVSLLVLWVSGLSGCGGDEGPATMFEAGAPVAVSGPSPLADCEQPVPEECENAEIEPWIAINPTNSENLVGVWMQDCAPRRAHVTAVSFDGGATWETVVIPGLTACSGGEWPQAADPWLGFAANGDLYHAALQSEGVVGGPPARKTIVVTKSVDGGRTWGDLAVISRSEPPLAEDKESIVADPDDPCKVYVGWTRFTGVNNAGTVLFSRTTDCGETWSEPEELYSSDPTGIGFQALPALGDNLLAFFRQNGWGPGTSLPFFVMRSPDAGATWPNEPTLIAVFTQNSPLTPDGAEVVRSARTGNFDVAIDRQSGDLVAVWEQLLTEDLFSNRVVFSQSTDGGSTWSAPVRIDRTPSSSAPTLEQAFLPSVEISQEGTIGVTYYNFQNDTLGDGRADTDHWFIHCNPKLADCNDPESWSDGIQLTPQSFDFLTAWHSPSPANPGLFLGDYVGLTSTGSDFFAFFPVTTDDDPANILFVPIRGR